MTLTDALSSLAAALQAVVGWRQALAVLAAACLYRLVPSGWRTWLLLPLSIAVLALGYQKWPVMIAVFVIVALAVYWAVDLSVRAWRRTHPVIIGLFVLYASLHATLGVLTFTDWLAWTGITAGDAIAQCGTVAMFGFFRLLGYAVDAGRAARAVHSGATAARVGSAETSGPTVDAASRGYLRPSPGAYLTWALFFPTFASLPLVGFQPFLAMQNAQGPSVDWRRALKHLGQVAIKSVTAGALYGLIQPSNALFAPETVSVGGAWLALAGQTVVFFLGFTATIDFAIGSAELLGIHLPDNFARIDVLLSNVRARDFWRDWNYSATHWLQEYVYRPLGGHRRGALRNTVLTMVFCGLWHSISPLGLVWGLALGAMMVGEHAWTRARIKGVIRWPTLPGPIRTIAWLALFALIQVMQLPFSYVPDGIAGAARYYARLSGLG